MLEWGGGWMDAWLDPWMDGWHCSNLMSWWSKKANLRFIFCLSQIFNIHFFFSLKGHKRKGEVLVHVSNKGAGSG